METSQTPLKISLPYRALGIIFGIIALLNVLIVFADSVLRPYYVLALVYATYAGLMAILAYGFWKMKKWVVSILGGLTLVMLVIDISRLMGDTKNLVQISISFAVLLALFAFSYFTRNFLNDDYKNVKMFGLFALLLIISQVAISFF